MVIQLNWYNRDNISWGKDDIVDLLQQYDPQYEEHYYKKDDTIYFWGRRNGVSVYIYSTEVWVHIGNPCVSQMYGDPIEVLNYFM